jgi:hypothetical protein
MLFVSMLGVIATTYYYSVERIEARSQILKSSMAERDMTSLVENLQAILWQTGSSRTLEISDSGGELRVQPSINLLFVSLMDNNSISDTVFNATIGQVTYDLPYSEMSDTGLYLKGDYRSILDQSTSTMTQLYIRKGAEHDEIVLRARPLASSTTYLAEDNETINNLRIYIVNLNSSQDIDLMGKIPLRISCTNIEDTTRTYNVPYQVDALNVTASLDGIPGQLSIPISGNASGTIINLELVVCEVKIETWIR